MPKAEKSEVTNLKPVELELIKLVCKEKTNLEMSKLLSTSLRRVEKVKTSLYLKTRTKSNIGLFKWAVRNGHFRFKIDRPKRKRLIPD